MFSWNWQIYYEKTFKYQTYLFKISIQTNLFIRWFKKLIPFNIIHSFNKIFNLMLKLKNKGREYHVMIFPLIKSTPFIPPTLNAAQKYTNLKRIFVNFTLSCILTTIQTKNLTQKLYLKISYSFFTRFLNITTFWSSNYRTF